MASVSDRLLKGSLWVTVSRLVANGLSTLATIILAWYLTPSDFGIVALATTMLVIVQAVTVLSLDQALIRHESPDESHFSAAWTLSATRGVILFLLFAALAYPAAAIYAEPRLFEVLLVLSLQLLVAGLANPRRVMLQRNLVFWQELVLNVAQKLAGFIVMVAIAVIYQSYWALVIGTLVAQITYVVASYCVAPFKPRVTFSHIREFFSFSVWITAAQVVNTLNWRFDYLLIGKFLDGAALGYYSLGGTLAATPTREATAPLTSVLYPAFANVRRDPARLAAAYRRSQAVVTAVALPAGVGTAAVAEPLVRLALGDKWLPVIFIIQALASVYALQTLGSLCQPLGMALGRTRTLFIRDSQMLLLRVPIITVGLIFWGMPGLILSRVFTGLLAALINMFIVQQLINVSVAMQLRANFRSLTSSFIMLLSVLAVNEYLGDSDSSFDLTVQLAVLVCVGFVIYCGTSYMLWRIMGRPDGPETEMKSAIVKVFSRKRSASY